MRYIKYNYLHDLLVDEKPPPDGAISCIPQILTLSVLKPHLFVVGLIASYKWVLLKEITG